MIDRRLKKFQVEYPKGQIIFHQDDKPDAMYFIVKGSVELSMNTKSSKYILHIAKENEFFGEMALFNNKRRSASAIAYEDCEVLKLEKNSLSILFSDRTYVENFITIMANRLYEADLQIEELVFISKEVRFLQALAIFWNDSGKKDEKTGNLLVNLNDFIQYMKQWYGLPENEVKKNIAYLQSKEILKIRKTSDGSLWVAFSPTRLKFFELFFRM
ncbi:MAG: cyclic nucleotide-binding domain-containing protein [Spirochaetia bacterium]|nr:cyclic nucleotide-binding domain-containing protein [Spirochaetia bacterium]